MRTISELLVKDLKEQLDRRNVDFKSKARKAELVKVRST